MQRWLIAFALTQAFEIPVYALGLRDADGSWGRRLAIAFTASLLTHPIVWWILPLAPRLWGCVGHAACWWQYVILAETFAVVAEAAWLHRCGVPRALGWSLAANATSAGFGMWLLA